MRKQLSHDLTSYDFLKTAAVLLMIVDHIGHYLFPDYLWLRVIGRWCVPIWFFLIGYAESRDMGWRLWAGLAILVAVNVLTGMWILPLNILASMLIVRAMIDPLMRAAMGNGNVFLFLCVALVLLAFPTSYIFEYGTIGIIMAIYGYLARHVPERYPALPVYGAFALLVFVLVQYPFFGFSLPQFVVTSIGLAAVMTGLGYFRPAAFPKATRSMPSAVAALFRLCGRRTLEIYVAHLVILKFAVLWWRPGNYVPFQWTFFPE